MFPDRVLSYSAKRTANDVSQSTAETGLARHADRMPAMALGPCGSHSRDLPVAPRASARSDATLISNHAW